MINGFKAETAQLNEYEKSVLVPEMVRCLQGRVGKENAANNTYIRMYMERQCGFIIKDARVRKLINYIRNNDLVPLLIASSAGYYIAQTRSEVDEYKTGLTNRINSMQAVCDAIEEQAKKAGL